MDMSNFFLNESVHTKKFKCIAQVYSSVSELKTVCLAVKHSICSPAFDFFSLMFCALMHSTVDF